MKFTGKLMELDKDILSEISQTRKTCMAYIHLYVDISCLVRDNKTIIHRATEVRYVWDQGVKIELIRKGNYNISLQRDGMVDLDGGRAGKRRQGVEKGTRQCREG